ncbi:MAG: hypothetical protein AB7O38_24330, partial [Pirellulaceae bacterium]
LDLAESLLDTADPRHAEALTQVAEAKREREARQQRLKANRRLIRSLVTACVLLLATGLASVSYQTHQVRKQRDLAQQNAEDATRQKTQAEEQRERAEKGEQEAIAQKQIAEEQTALAERQTQVAKNESEAAKRAREAAIRAQAEEAKQRELADQNARKAREAETVALAERDNANYEKYVALIGLAAAKIEENAFGYARELLQQCPPALRNWEWGRLMYLCEQSVQVVEAGTPINAVAFSADGRQFATGGWNGLAQVFQAQDGQRVSTMQHAGSYVYAVAYCPSRPEIATGSSGTGQNLQIWHAATGQLVRSLVGHTDDVLSVVYSRDGQRLLTASRDNTARLWNCETGELIHTYEGHTWWVWAAAFSPDERRVVTASQDGTALVWSLDGRQRSAPFMGHQGPVFAVAFAPDGERIATGGHDKRVLIWKAAEVVPFDYETLLQGGQVPVPRSQELLGHLGAVRSVAFSGDGTLILSGGHDNVVRVWNAESGNLVKTLRGHDEWVQSCAFSPDNRQALSGSRDGAARLWDIQGYEEARVLQGRWLRGHEDAVMAVAFSPRDDQIATASRDRTARTWDTRTGRPHTSFDEGHFFLASHAAFYPGHKRLATSAGDNTTRVWDVETGGQLLLLEETGRAAAVAVANSGRWIATGGGTTDSGAWIAQLWDAGSGGRKRVLSGHAGQVTALAFSPDDQFLYTGDSHGRGTLWRTESGVAVARLDWHTSKVAAAEFLRDGQRLLTASDDKTVAQWDTSQLSSHPDRVVPLTQLTLKHDESVLALDVADNQKLAITSTTGGQVQVWDLGRAVPVRSLPSGTSEVNTVELSSDGRRALTAHPTENCVRLWDVVSSREIRGFGSQPDSEPPLLDLNRLGGSVWSARFVAGADRILTVGGNQALLWDLREETPHREPLMRFSPHAAVVSVDYSPDGKLLVTGSWDNSARIWDVASGKDIQQLVGAHTGTVNCATFSPEGKFVLTTSDDKTARLWDRSTGQVVRDFVGHAGPVRFGLFSARGDRILTTSDDKTARLWDAASGRELQEFKSHEWGVLCAAFSADGTRIITGSADSSARIWDTATGQVLLTLSGHTASVTSVAFAPDGQRVLTASDDFTAKLWDSQTGKEILSLKGHSQELTSVAFSHDGQYALTGSQDGTAILWLTRGWKPHAVARHTGPSP